MKRYAYCVICLFNPLELDARSMTAVVNIQVSITG